MKSFLFALLGLGLAIVVCHCFVHDLRQWADEMKSVFILTFTETSMSRHDSEHLVLGMFSTVGKLLLIMVFFD